MGADIMSRKVVPGDVICVRRSIYDHYGIYSGQGKVIHYATDFHVRKAPFIHEVSLSEFLGDAKKFIVCEFMPYYEGKNHQEWADGLADMLSVSSSSIISMPDFTEHKHRDYEREWKEKNYRLYSPSETLERARRQAEIVAKEDLWDRTYKAVFSLFLPDRILEPSDKLYIPSSNNCEHFVTWCKTGIMDSMQVNELAIFIELPRAVLEAQRAMVRW